jgi:hypothetical protein
MASLQKRTDAGYGATKDMLQKSSNYTRLQKPNKITFKGDVFVLTDGLCMSSCADFVAIMQANKTAVIIGEETGGGYQGNTSGLIPNVQMECGIAVDVPLLNTLIVSQKIKILDEELSQILNFFQILMKSFQTINIWIR